MFRRKSWHILGVKPWPVGVREVASDHWLVGTGSKHPSTFSKNYSIGPANCMCHGSHPSSFRLLRQANAKEAKAWQFSAIPEKDVTEIAWQLG